MFSMQQQLVQLVPQHLQTHFVNTIEKYSINTVFRCVHFLSQIIHESGNFRIKSENLFYSNPERVAQIFKGDFDTNKDKVITPDEIEFAKQYTKNPQKLANYVYANQGGNGNEASGDGWKYRGRGFIQTTLRDNYQALSNHLQMDFVNNPDILLQDEYAMLSAGDYWDLKQINKIADRGLTEDVIKEVTRKINPALVGLKERTEIANNICNQISYKA